MSQKRPGDVSCIRCQYYKHTWERGHQHACLLFGFKTKKLPSDAVYESSDMPCHGFLPRETRNTKDIGRPPDGLPPYSTFDLRA